MTESPIYRTTIDQHTGNHSTGMPLMALKEIVTSFRDYSEQSWAEQSPSSRLWWTETLRDIHEATVELESLNADERAEAKECYRNDAGDLEDVASAIRNAIESAKAAS